MKRFCAALILVAATIAAVFTVSPARAATPAHGNPTLVVRLDADGSLTLSQRNRDAGAMITLPSVPALPAEIEALIPRTEERKRLALSADSKGPYRNFLNVMYAAKKAGFSEIGILGPEKETQGRADELVVDLKWPERWPPSDNALFISLGEDEQVVVSVGIVGIAAHAQPKLVNLASALDTIAALAPKGRPQKELYFRADFAVPIGNAIGLLSRLRAIGFAHIQIMREETD